MRELKIEQVEDGYIVNMMDYTGNKRVFKSFRKLIVFLRDYFGEHKERKVAIEFPEFPTIPEIKKEA